MYTLPFIAVLVAVACAGPVPQSTLDPAADMAGASTPMTDPAMAGAGGIGGAQSTTVRPSRRTLKPFSPLTLKPRTTPESAGGLGGVGATGASAASHTPHTFTPFAARTTPSGEAGASRPSRTPFTLKPFSRRTTPSGEAGAAAASRTPLTFKPFSPRARTTQQPFGGVQSTPISNALAAETSVGAAEPTIAGERALTSEAPERILSTSEAAGSVTTTSETPIPNRIARALGGEWGVHNMHDGWSVSDMHEGWQIAEASSTVKTGGIQDPATTPVSEMRAAELHSTPENRIVADGSSTSFSPAGISATTPLNDMRAVEMLSTPENRIHAELSSSLSPAAVASTTPLNRIGAAVDASSTSFSPAGISATTPLNDMRAAEMLSTPENRIHAAGASSTSFQPALGASTTPFNQPGGIDMSSTPSTTLNGINGPSTFSTAAHHRATPSTTLNPANPLNRVVRGVQADSWSVSDMHENWQLAETSSTVGITELTTSEIKTSETTPLTPTTTTTPSALNIRHARGVMENPEGWQMAETSSTMEVTDMPTDMTTSFADLETSTFEEDETTTSEFDDSTTSAFDFTTSDVEFGNNEDWTPGWQLAETSSTLEIGTTTSAMNDMPSSTANPTIGNSFDDNWSG